MIAHASANSFLVQEVEFNVVDLDGASSASPRSGGGADAKSPSSASLSASTSSADDAMARTPAEQLLVKKTRHLESEVTRLKVLWRRCAAAL